MSWIYLSIAGLLEIGFTTCLKLSEGFTRLWPSLAFIPLGVGSFFLLSRVLQTIPVGTAYAVWTGIGVFGTAVVSMVFFKDPVSFGRLFFLSTLVASIIGLRLVSPH